MTVKKLLADATQILTPISDEARLESELLLAFVLKTDRTSVLTNLDTEVSSQQQKIFSALIQKRFHRTPLAYLVGKKEFYGLDFFVDQNVLIPRPETELLVDYIIHWTKSRPTPKNGWKILDVGTGSGAIAISLAVHLPSSTIYASDISSKALAIAKKNAALHHIGKQIRFSSGPLVTPLTRHSELMKNPVGVQYNVQEGAEPPRDPTQAIGFEAAQARRDDEEIDIFVANLPYIPSSRIPSLQPEVKDHEPIGALDGGADGFDLYRKLLDQIKKIKVKPTLLVFEIDVTQGEIARQEIQKQFLSVNIQIRKDLNNFDRYIVVEFIS